MRTSLLFSFLLLQMITLIRSDDQCTNLTKASFGSGDGQWNYGNINEWGTNLGYTSCNGLSQSPINIVTTNVVPASDTAGYLVYLESTDVGLTFKNSTIEVEGNFTVLKAHDISGPYSQYNSLQFHIHEPSEHTIDGKSYPLELHIVHALNTSFCGQVSNVLTVVGILFEIDDTVQNKFLNTFANTMGTTDVQNFNIQTTILANIGTSTSVYEYTGSLTTPPCHEVVNWKVITETMKITTKDMNKIKSHFTDKNLFPKGATNRPVQKLNAREVSKSDFYLSKASGNPQSLASLYAQSSYHSVLVATIFLSTLLFTGI